MKTPKEKALKWLDFVNVKWDNRHGTAIDIAIEEAIKEEHNTLTNHYNKIINKLQKENKELKEFNSYLKRYNFELKEKTTK